VNLADRKQPEVQEVPDPHFDLVGGRGGPGGEPPFSGQSTFPEEAQHGVRVSNIDREHWTEKYTRGQRCSAQIKDQEPTGLDFPPGSECVSDVSLAFQRDLRTYIVAQRTRGAPFERHAR
jgi:hypothetical protein